MKFPITLRLIYSFLLVCLIISVVILSMVPPISRDALTHHLFIPKLYIEHGGIYEIPSVVFSYYPMNLDLLYTAALLYGNEIIPKFIHFAFAGLTALLIFQYLKNRTSVSNGLLGALFFLSIPVVVKLSITVYVDLGLVFFSTLSLLFLFKWVENEFRIHYLLISAMACGLALGTKYNGLLFFFILYLFVPITYLRNSCKKSVDQIKAVGFGVIFLAVSLAVFSPWMVRNYIWTRNPVYPLYNNVFASFQGHNITSQDSLIEGVEDRSHDLFEEKNKSGDRDNPYAIRRLLYGENWWQILSIPVRVFFQGKDNDGKYFDGKLSPFLFFLPLMAFFRKFEESAIVTMEKKVLAGFSVLVLLLAPFLTDMRIRYIGPIIPPLVILSVFGLDNVETFITHGIPIKYRKIGTIGFFIIISAMLLLNANYLLKQFRIVNPIGYLSGEIGRDKYIEHFRPEYPAIQYANQNLAEDVKIFTIFLGKRGYYFDREILSFEPAAMQKAIEQTQSPEGLLDVFEKKEITHLLIRHDIQKDWIVGSLEEKEGKRLLLFIRGFTTRLYYKHQYGLYKINLHEK